MLFLTAHATEVYINWLSTVVEDFDNHDQDAWVSHAEAVAWNTPARDDVIIEVHANESLTGRPETIKLPPEWFAAFPLSKF
tara:strand:+ start:718 stop:960 length:243 start_codon:yes stop_codon:yes gene_type:complete